jgi:hypothetical protein
MSKPGTRSGLRYFWRGRIQECSRPYAFGNSQNFFINFVDAMFTTSLEPLFTKAFEVIGEKPANDCVCRAGHAD